ncbi:MAG: transcriptional repressor [Bradymonadales bacterium]|jgi:Fur family ferric uptake transcriptional regulator
MLNKNPSLLLKSVNVRVTQQRETVLAYLIEKAQPIRHAELIDELKPYHIERVTLYRVLSKLMDVGLVHRVQGSDGTWRYCAHDLSEEHCPGGHPHFLCEKCGDMICLEGQRLPRVEVPKGYEVHNKQFLLQGYCNRCK